MLFPQRGRVVLPVNGVSSAGRVVPPVNVTSSVEEGGSAGK